MRFHELAAQFPDAAARAVHDTFYHTLTILFNAAPPANVDPKAQHVDTIPCKLTPGILGYIAGYLGIVEPQMRLTEHLHMLVQSLGFQHPRSYFESADFCTLFRRVWSYFASVCFTAVEAWAGRMSVPDAMRAARNEPLIPINATQER